MVIIFSIAVHVAFYCLNNEDGSCKHASTVAGALNSHTLCVVVSVKMSSWITSETLSPGMRLEVV